MSVKDLCPCGLGEPYSACCGPLHAGERDAATAEQLMRSRYSAFAVGDADYLLRTWHPKTRPAELDLDPAQRWLRLEIVSRTGGGPFDAEGTVDFIARYRHDGRTHVLSERSRFTRTAKTWLYVDGDVEA
ncbi:YchJ family protein [Saccharopolyspora sp. ID03-671]|uniref:YchJ family protein n=1 Tax=Saccharopolyspora sp. ID03-671 TaxID=3073066 RepID=UPI003243711D